MKIFWTLAFLLQTILLSAQVPFYSFRMGEMEVSSDSAYSAYVFTVPIQDFKKFRKDWESEMDDVGNDVDMRNNRMFATEVEISDDVEEEFTVVSTCADKGDSAEVQFAFLFGSSSLDLRKNELRYPAEKFSKNFLTKVYKAYRNRYLKEAEEAWEDLSDEVEDQEDKLESIHTNVARLRRKIASTKSEREEKQSRSIALNAELLQVQEEVRGGPSDDRKRELNESLRRLEREKSKLEDFFEEADSDILEYENEISELNSQETRVQRNLEALRLNELLAKKRVEEMKFEIESYRTR